MATCSNLLKKQGLLFSPPIACVDGFFWHLAVQHGRFIRHLACSSFVRRWIKKGSRRFQNSLTRSEDSVLYFTPYVRFFDLNIRLLDNHLRRIDAVKDQITCGWWERLAYAASPPRGLVKDIMGRRAPCRRVLSDALRVQSSCCSVMVFRSE